MIKNKIANLINNTLNSFRKESKIIYLDYTLIYNKNNSLLKLIKKEKSKLYEKEETYAMLDLMNNIDDPIILDIGANIGLISLNLMKYKPKAKIFAFEPNPKTYNYLSANIKNNGLKNINIYNLAFSDKTGEIDFCIHNEEHNSGDGIIDTGRAGKYEKIKVCTDTLDNWWIDNNKPKINFIKIDTEGAELLVFRGAKQVFETCKPVLFSEIHELNIRNYPYSLDELFYYITNEMQYDIFHPINNIMVKSVDEIKEFNTGNYILKPKL